MTLRDDAFEHLALMIDGPPERVFQTVDLHEGGIGWLCPTSSDRSFFERLRTWTGAAGHH